jgi:hypothetical protein
MVQALYFVRRISERQHEQNLRIAITISTPQVGSAVVSIVVLLQCVHVLPGSWVKVSWVDPTLDGK